MAIDLPGFGHSQRRDGLLSPQAMGEFMIRVADAFELASPHVIGPDVGTAAALFAAALYPGRFRSLIVGGGAAAFPLRLGGLLKDWVEAPDLEGYRRADPQQIVAGVLTSIERYTLLDFVREDYLASYQGDRFVESMRYVRSYPAQLRALCKRLPTIQTPVQIIAGARDPMVPGINAEFLNERLPINKLNIMDAGHSPGRTQQTSTPPLPPAGGKEAMRPPNPRQHADRRRTPGPTARHHNASRAHS